jgi:hypothetical protein
MSKFCGDDFPEDFSESLSLSFCDMSKFCGYELPEDELSEDELPEDELPEDELPEDELPEDELPGVDFALIQESSFFLMTEMEFCWGIYFGVHLPLFVGFPIATFPPFLCLISSMSV